MKEIKELYNEINTPQELLEFMENNINYGFHGIDDKDYTPEDKDFNTNCREKWILSDANRVLKYKLGHCWDQVELERDWFSKKGYEFKTIFIWFLFNKENNYPTHTYLVYKENNKWYWFEHANYNNKGIHEFNSLKDAILFQMKKHIEYASKNNEINEEIINNIHIYEYNNPKYGCNMAEFIKNIINSAKDITHNRTIE